jgi:succinyl-CoA synthetase beta subunit
LKIHEYQAKEILRRYGVATPRGKVTDDPEEARRICEELGGRCVVKAQVHAGGRGKGGGVKLAHSPEMARDMARQILGMQLVTHQTGPEGQLVRKVFIEETASIAQELYLSITLDRAQGKPVVMGSSQGGMDIEEVAENNPDALARLHVDPLLGFQPFHGRRLAYAAGVDADVVRPIGDMLAKLYDAFVKEDATLVEVNPLIITADRSVKALDAKVTLDDNALYRHSDNAGLRNTEAEDPQEQMARERGLTYVKLDGNVGILGNGAGLVMSTLDVVKYAGGEPANFLDAGGGANAEQITQAVEVILSNEKVTAVLFNIFGGITRCDEVAKGLIEAFNQIKPEVPFVVRLDGTNDEEGRKLLADADLPNVHPESTMLGAAERVVELAGAA